MSSSKDTHQTPTDVREADDDCAYCIKSFKNPYWRPDQTAYWQQLQLEEKVTYDTGAPSAPSQPTALASAQPSQPPPQTCSAASGDTYTEGPQASHPSRSSPAHRENPTAETGLGGLYRPSDRRGVSQNSETAMYQESHLPGRETVTQPWQSPVDGYAEDSGQRSEAGGHMARYPAEFATAERISQGYEHGYKKKP